MIDRDDLFRSRKQNVTFDDVSLVEGKSTVKSRSEIDTSISLPKGYTLELPVFTSSMDTITSKDMAEVVLREGASIVHHRYCSVEDRVENIRYGEKVRENSRGLNGVAVGYEDNYYDIESFIEAGADLVSLDLAHAWHEETSKWIAGKADLFEDVLLVVGSFSHPEGIEWLYDEEIKNQEKSVVDMIRVSQGGGSVCTTRQKAGIGKPTLQAVMDYTTETDLPYEVIADGGIKYPGDIAKSLGAGACGGMIGSMLAGTDECPGRVIHVEGDMYKEYRGMASKNAKEDGESVDTNFVEGVTARVKLKGPAENVLHDIRDGLQSSVSTCGFESVSELRRNAEFIRLSHSSQIESSPHQLRHDS